MRKVKFIQTIVVLLITIFIFNIMEPLCNTYAEINSEKENKNLVIINDDIDNFIYTYTKNNIKYMVKENSTKDYKSFKDWKTCGSTYGTRAFHR